jgi:type III secretion system FlhB-like substrate exporter
MSWKKMTPAERAELARLLDKMAWDPDIPVNVHSTINRVLMALKRLSHPMSRL